MNIYESISAIMQEGYSIGKDKKNQQQGFMYRGIDDVMNTFQPLLSKYKVFVVPEVLDREREERTTEKGKVLIYSILTIRYTFYAEDGSSISAVVVGEGMDSGDKASNKAMAVGMKYAMFQTFCIPTEEMRDADPDRFTPEPSIAPPGSPAYEATKEKPLANLPVAKVQMFVCEKCGKKLVPYKDKNGKEIGVRAHAAGCEKKFGQILCLDCIHDLYPDSFKA